MLDRGTDYTAEKNKLPRRRHQISANERKKWKHGLETNDLWNNKYAEELDC